MRKGVLIVEDDLIVCTNLEVILTENNHEICGMADNAVDALLLFTLKKPEIVICDIGLKGSTDGIELAKKLNEIARVPILFLTSYQDEEVFRKAKTSGAFAFINKPIERKSFERTVALAMEFGLEHAVFTTGAMEPANCLYTRVGHKLKKINIREIEFVEVDGKYCSIMVGSRRFNCKISLKELADKLPPQQFIQINRNALINLELIEDIDMSQPCVKMPGGEIVISRTFRDNLMSRINLI